MLTLHNAFPPIVGEIMRQQCVCVWLLLLLTRPQAMASRLCVAARECGS